MGKILDTAANTSRLGSCESHKVITNVIVVWESQDPCLLVFAVAFGILPSLARFDLGVVNTFLNMPMVVTSPRKVLL